MPPIETTIALATGAVAFAVTFLYPGVSSASGTLGVFTAAAIAYGIASTPALGVTLWALTGYGTILFSVIVGTWVAVKLPF
jgi:hypothetical protein